MAPRRILLVHGKAEASFAHSKRFAHHDIAVHVGASMFEGATEPRASVWSARSLLPLCNETSKTVRPAIRSLRFKSTKKRDASPFGFYPFGVFLSAVVLLTAADGIWILEFGFPTTA